MHADCLENFTGQAISLEHSSFPLHPRVGTCRISESHVRVGLVSILDLALGISVSLVYLLASRCGHSILVFVRQIVSDAHCEEEAILIQVHLSVHLGVDVESNCT